jgi:regulation of enolase protein 1 (concanavalin A-like superfamily)
MERLPQRFFTALAFLLLAVLMAQTALAGPTTFTSDAFNSRNLLRPLWTFTDPNGDASLRLSGYKTDNASVQISVPGGSAHDLWSTGYNAPRIMQACTNTDFTAEAKFFSGMQGTSFVSYQGQGIVVEQDESNLIRFDLTTGHEVDSVKAFAAVFLNGLGSPVTKINNKHFAAYGAAPMWLRVTRAGNTWKMYYSLNGSTFTLADSFVQALTVSKIGVFVVNAGPNPAPFTSSIDYFFNNDSKITPEDGSPVADNLGPLIYNVSSVVKPNAMVIRWKTDEPADGMVEWGSTSAYGETPISHSGAYYDHRLIVTGLNSATDYHFRVKGTDDSLRTNASGDFAVYSGNYIDDTQMISDDFGGTAIDGTLWSTVNPLSDATFTIAGKKLSIGVAGGVAHDIWTTTGYQVPRIMQQVKNSANVYEFTAKFTTPLVGSSTNIMTEGIVVEQDTNNILRASFSYDGSAVRLFIAGFYDGYSSVDVIANEAIAGATSNLWLRMTQGGGTFRIYYSVNGTTWTFIPSFPRPMNTTKIGVFAGNAGSSPLPFTCSVEYVATTLPAKPYLALPLNNAVDIPTPPTMQWDTTASATTYRLQLSTDAGFGTVAYSDTAITGTSKEVAGLLNTTKYYWRVRGKNAAGVGANSDVYAFTTAISAPAVPTLVAPAANAVDVVVSPTLIWTKSPAAVTYRLQVATDSLFVSGIVFNDSTLTDTVRTMPALTNLTKYYWRVNAKNTGGASSYSTRRAFTTISAIPLAPVHISPPNNAVNQQITVSLRWNRAVGTQTYHLQVGTDPTFATGLVVNDSSLTDTVKAMSGLANSTVYYWRVNAKNTAGTGPYSASWAFTTIVSNPSIPVLISPADGATNQDLTVQYVWRKTAGATSYRLQVATDATFASGIVVNDSTITDSTKSVGGLSYNMQYYWRVSSKNIGGASPYSSIWNFRTYDSDPSVPRQMDPANAATGLLPPVTIVWTRPAGATSFRLQVATDSAFVSGFVVNDATITDTMKVVNGLNYLSTYYWRVNADAVAGTSPYSPRRVFTTGIPTASNPSLIYPGPDQSVYPASIVLGWLKAIPAVDRYWVDVAVDEAFTFALPPDSMVTDTLKTISGLENSKSYYWRVRAHNAGGWGPYSDVRKFTRDITSVDGRPETPTEFALEQNYPNPFNPATQIEFSVPTESRVTIEVYNLLGQRVATLLDEVRSVGYHVVKFDAASMPSGLYLYRMAAGQTSFIRKMMLVK